MRFRVKITGVILILLALVGLLTGLFLGKADRLTETTVTSKPEAVTSRQYLDNVPLVEKQGSKGAKEQGSKGAGEQGNQSLTTAPTPKTSVTSKNPVPKPNPAVARQGNNSQGVVQKSQTRPPSQNTSYFAVKTTAAFAAYKPRYEIAWADPSNYGERYSTDINGNPVTNPPIIVLHETAAPASSAVNFFQNSNEDENVQASYHTMIKLDGTVVYLVPPDKRAFGAANSIFDGSTGPETVRTSPDLPPSVNNFAYHVGLETPPSGLENKQPTHDGYTDAQYYSLAWLIAQSNVPDERITTHKAVDRSGQRIDPRSFDFSKFFNILHSFRILSPANS